ncbi:MAG: flagellar export protein FliJ [Deltaproteobacteria bacterium]|nr:flagellar export protein FliJ [Deltaproteobacteria bacterium]
MNRLGTINKVLHLKERREEEIELEVRALRDSIAVKGMRLRSLEEAYMETIGELQRKRSRGTIASQELGIYQNYLFHLQVEMDHRKAEIARALSALDTCHGALVEAHKETRVVEALKDRRTRENAKEELRKENKLMDSLSPMARERS